MKTFIVATVLAISSLSLATEKAPAPFEDSAILRVMKDKSVQRFNGNEYMIVRRTAKKAVPVVTKTEEVRVEVVREVVKEPKKNMLILHGGYGPDGLKSPYSGRVDQDYDFLMGLGYRRQMNDRIGLEMTGLSNKTGLLGIDFGF